MGKSPAFQLYAADFYMDTVGWSAIQVGAYFRLLLHEWVNGPLPDDMAKLSRIAGVDIKTMGKIWTLEVGKKFEKNEDQQWENSRLEHTRIEQTEYKEKLANSGRLGGLTTQGLKRDKQSKASSKALSKNKALLSSSSPSPSKEDINNKILYLDFVFLSEEEHQKLVAQFGEHGAKERIDRINVYLGSTGKKYKSHYYTILNWERRNGDGEHRPGFKVGQVAKGDTGAGKYQGIGEVLD